MTLTQEQIADGWRETLHIDKALKDGIYQTAYFNGLGEIIVQDELLNKKEAIGAICRFDTFRVLTPITPNTLTISVNDAQAIAKYDFDCICDCGSDTDEIMSIKSKIRKQLEAIK